MASTSICDSIATIARDTKIPLIREMSQISHKTSINLGLGQLTWAVDPQIEEVFKNPQPSDYLYSPNAGSQKLREAVAARYGYGNADNAVITIGVQEAVYDTVAALKRAGAKKVLIPNIAFGIYQKISSEFGLDVQKFNLTPSSLGISFADFDEAVELHKPDVVFLNFPGNPTGIGIDDGQQSMIASVLRAHGSPYVISDEIYRDLTFFGEKPRSFSTYYDNTVVVDGVSKSGACAGTRVGWAYTKNPDLAKIITGVGTNVKSSPPTITMRAALPIVDGRTAPTIASYNERLAKNFNITAEFLSDVDIQVPQSTGGFYVFPNLRMRDTETFCKELAAKENGVTIIPGKAFGAPSHVRISFASDKIEEGMKRFVATYCPGF